MRKSLHLALALVVVGSLALAAAPPSFAGPVADTDVEYTLCARVYPDPHAHWPAPTPPSESPFAKGNAPCRANDFVTYAELVSGMTYMEGLFPDFIDFIKLEEDFGDGTDCATSTSNSDMCSAGLPRQGASGGLPGRVKQDLYMIRVTDERVANAGKKYFVFPLSIHGIERAGAEAGVRAAEDLATWAYCEALAGGQGALGGGIEDNGLTDCGNEDPIPHPVLETQPDTSLTAGTVLRQSAVYFVFANPDGWKRGDPDNLVRFYQRYNGNGVDMNRDWPTIGATFKPYTPWSEPETRHFGEVLKRIRSQWAGGIDLHGQLIDRAFSFTLMGASQRDYAKDQRILQAVRGAWQDAEQRLAWSPAIKPNDAPPPCEEVDPGDPCDERLYGVQWGTVWDTIAYQVTGAFGDWIDSPLGLGGDGIDNEMSMSHLSNCGVGSCYLTEFEQLHVDGNKSLVYAMLNFSLLPENTDFEAPGRIGYVFDPTVLRNRGVPPPDPYEGLPPQDPILNESLDPTNDFIFEFTVLGPDDGFYNGGLIGQATPMNVAGVSPSSVTSLILEQFNPPEEDPPVDEGCGGADDSWGEVNRYYNQASTYLQGGQAVHGNYLRPGQYRICISGSIEEAIIANGGYVDLDINFTTEAGWPDPGQLPYAVSNMRFFTDLAKYIEPGPLVKSQVDRILSGQLNLDQFTSLVIADDPFPGGSTNGPASPEAVTWAERLTSFVENGGNLVLTDGAIQNLGLMGLLAPEAIDTTKVYAGFIAFTNNNGNTATYDDQMAENVNQPGAAEGPSHRHQTYEPVPIGFAVDDRSSCSAATTCFSPVWTVDQAAWTAAGGRTVGQIGNNRVGLGELALGDGVIRIIGALLPMPSEESYHPFGLANYALTYSGYQVMKNALQWQRPPFVATIRADGHAHTDYKEDGKAANGDVHIRVNRLFDLTSDAQAPTGKIDYQDRRRNPPGPAAEQLFCMGGTPTSVLPIAAREIRVTGTVRCDGLASVRSFVLRVRDYGTRTPDRYTMQLLTGQGATVYQWSAAITRGLGDLTVSVVTG